MMDQPVWRVEEIQRCCHKPLHPEAVKGIDLFNQAEYFEAHEALEIAWREETDPRRDLYRGILLAAVTILHMQRGNFEGALKVSRRCLKWLAPFGENCCGVQVGALRQEILSINQHLEQEGAGFLQLFKFTDVQAIVYDRHYPVAYPKIHQNKAQKD